MKWKFIFIVLVIAVIQNAMAQDSLKVFKNRISFTGNYELFQGYQGYLGYQRSLWMNSRAVIDVYFGVTVDLRNTNSFGLFRANYRYVLNKLDIITGFRYGFEAKPDYGNGSDSDISIFSGVNFRFFGNSLSLGTTISVGRNYAFAQKNYNDFWKKTTIFIPAIELGINF